MKNIMLLMSLTMSLQMGVAQDLIPYRVGNKWGYANEKGEMVIKPKFDGVGEFRNKLTWVKKNGKYGYINKKGRKKTRIKFDQVKNFGSGSTTTVWKDKERYCINLKGKKSACLIHCPGVIGIARVFQTYRSGDRIGIIKQEIGRDEEGNTVEKIDSIPPIWKELKENQKGYAAVKKDSLWGVINKAGELVVEYHYELIEVHPIAFKRNHFFKVKKNGKYGFLNEEGNLVVEPKYHKAEFYTQSKIAKVWVNDDFWGYIDETGNEFF